MTYQGIAPFPHPGVLDVLELRDLAALWRRKRSQIQDDNRAYDRFLAQLQREWAIETGIIERLYTWDRGVTQVLIEEGVDAALIAHRAGVTRQRAAHIDAVIRDHMGIVDQLFAYIKDDRPLTEAFIRGLQAQFTANQDHTEALTPDGTWVKVPLVKGAYKKHPNNPRRPDGQMHSYCPPELTGEEMERLVRWYRESEANHPPEVGAAWLHHRFTQIHPFQDGNGRVARALASLVFLKAGLFPLVMRDADRKAYISALETADAGNLRPLVELFVRRQKEAILKALGLMPAIETNPPVDRILANAFATLAAKKTRVQQERARVLDDRASRLHALATHRIQQLVDRLQPKLHDLSIRPTQYRAWMDQAGDDGDRRHYFRFQIVKTAKALGYFANLSRYRAWVRLSIQTDQSFRYVMSVHGFGGPMSEVFAALACTYAKEQGEDGHTAVVALRPAAPEFFQFNTEETPETAEARFKEWLEASLAMALAAWQRSLEG